jgi:GNAT superfamily N-acetyltransferase
MNEPIRTRIATLDDAPELARLNLLFNQIDDAAEVIAARMADSRRVETPIIAELERRVVGFASVHVSHSIFYPSPRAEVTELFVEEAYRRRGVGRALMAHAEHIAREQDAADLIVLTDFYNHESQGLYRALGFENNDIVMIKVFVPEEKKG